MWSYWEQEGLFKADLVVIGAGLTGLSAAINYKQKRPNKRVLIIDRSPFGQGASTKNAGFGCIGSPSELLMNLEDNSKEEVWSLVERRYRGLEKLLNRFGTKALGVNTNAGSSELLRSNDLYVLDKLDWLNSELKNVLPREPFQLQPKESLSGRFNSEYIKREIDLQFEFPIDTGSLIKTLRREAGNFGIDIWGGVSVTEVSQSPNHVNVTCKSSWTNELMQIRGVRVLNATNAFHEHLSIKPDIKPGRGLVLCSSPLNLPVKGIYHLEKGNVYFREIDSRLMIGGGRHWFRNEEETSQEGINKSIERGLIEITDKLFPELKFDWEYKWSGIMAFREGLEPQCDWISKSILNAVGLNGMGVAFSWQFGSEIAEKLLHEQ